MLDEVYIYFLCLYPSGQNVEGHMTSSLKVMMLLCKQTVEGRGNIFFIIKKEKI